MATTKKPPVKSGPPKPAPPKPAKPAIVKVELDVQTAKTLAAALNIALTGTQGKKKKKKK